MILDEVSQKILRILQEKARIPNVEVARQIKMAPSAVLERIRKLEKNGVICGYEVRLNPERFNRATVAFVMVAADPADQEQVGRELSRIADIQEVHYIAGNDVFLVKVRVAGSRELARLLRERIGGIQGVRSTQTQIVLETYKETARIPLKDS